MHIAEALQNVFQHLVQCLKMLPVTPGLHKLQSSFYHSDRKHLSHPEKTHGAVLHVVARCARFCQMKGDRMPLGLACCTAPATGVATCHRLTGRGSSVSGVLFHWQTHYCMGAGTFET